MKNKNIDTKGIMLGSWQEVLKSKENLPSHLIETSVPQGFDIKQRLKKVFEQDRLSSFSQLSKDFWTQPTFSTQKTGVSLKY